MLVALGTPLKGRPRPWEHFKVPALMVNAYEIIGNEKLRRDIQAKGLHDFLNYNGLIFVDSGGFQAMKHRIDIDVDKLIDIYKIAEADYYFSLDYPSPSARNSKIRILRTIENFEKLRRAIEHVIPVVHPNIKRALIEYDAYKKHHPKYIAIGGLVPLMLTTRGLLNGRKMAIDLITEIRKRHKRNLHVMGLGAPTVIQILKVLKCNSTDSAAWRIKAAHGKIMIPNKGERYISNKKANFGVVPLCEDDKRNIEKTRCPLLKEYDWDYLEKSFEARALLNAWVTLYCAEESEQLNGPFATLLEYAKQFKL
ncbi:MAG: tRNA-ribosyltransferase [Candidatus Bathyarchaeia archaeon]